MKTYPLAVYPLREEGREAPCGYWSKGHHQTAAFLFAVRSEWGDARPHSLWRGWWRWVPGVGGIPASPGARGAFPVTVGEWEPGERGR